MAKTPTSKFVAGKEIKIDQAKRYVDEYLPLKQQLKNSILIKITNDERQNRRVKIKETEIHFHSEANAFLFSEEMVTRFFTKTKDNPNPAKYLMVLLAAKYEGSEKSNPTVVLAGVNDHPDKKDSFVSLDIKYPATEQPPVITNYKFPDPEKKDSKYIEFTII